MVYQVTDSFQLKKIEYYKFLIQPDTKTKQQGFCLFLFNDFSVKIKYKKLQKLNLIHEKSRSEMFNIKSFFYQK